MDGVTSESIMSVDGDEIPGLAHDKGEALHSSLPESTDIWNELLYVIFHPFPFFRAFGKIEESCALMNWTLPWPFFG